MTGEYIRYGNVVAYLEEVPPELKEEDVNIGSLAVVDPQKVYYRCEFVHYDVLIDDVPKGLLYIKKNFTGYYLDEFITVMPGYGLIAKSILGTNRTVIGLREGLLNRRSAYLIRSEVRRHVHRHMFLRNLVPLHASGAVISCNTKEVVLIVGPSGSGKSTLTWLLCQYDNPLLTDDNIVTDEQGMVFGAGGDILVRPDFFDIYGYQDRDEVSPNLKYSLQVSNASDCAFTTKAILFPFINKNRKSELRIVSATEMMPRFLEAHIGWVFSENEKRAIERSFQLLTSYAKIGLVSIGQEPLGIMDDIQHFLN